MDACRIAEVVQGGINIVIVLSVLVLLEVLTWFYVITVICPVLTLDSRSTLLAQLD